MAHYCFHCPQGQEVAGCIDRICCYSPFVRVGVNPRTGQQVQIPDAQQTWAWLMGLGYPFPPGVQFLCTIITPAIDPTQRAPNVYCVQKTEPQAVRAPIDAPYAQPVGNRGAPSAPVMPSAPGAPPRPPDIAGMYDQLPDHALAGNADPMMGDIDGAAGTYTDIDGNGVETQRQMRIQASVPVQQRARQQ